MSSGKWYRVIFPLKYGPKTLKHPWSISLKTLDHLKITFSKYNGTTLKTNFGLREVPELENMHFHFHAFSSWGTSRGQRSVFKHFSNKVQYINV